MMSMILLIVYALGFIVAYCWMTILRGKGEQFIVDDDNILIPSFLWPLMLLAILVHEIEERREKRKEE